MFSLFDDRLELRHYGRPFDADDVRGICAIAEGTKSDSDARIGRFGIGFKSVYAYTTAPEIHSGDEHFSIVNYVLPYEVGSRPLEPRETLIILPFNHPDIVPEVAKRDIGEKLRRLEEMSLLFLNSITEIS